MLLKINQANHKTIRTQIDISIYCILIETSRRFQCHVLTWRVSTSKSAAAPTPAFAASVWRCDFLAVSPLRSAPQVAAACGKSKKYFDSAESAGRTYTNTPRRHSAIILQIVQKIKLLAKKPHGGAGPCRPGTQRPDPTCFSTLTLKPVPYHSSFSNDAVILRITKV